jgi:hypothetical protein
MHPLEEFTLFPKLPQEMQLEIWKRARPAARVVEINVKVDENNNETLIATSDFPVLLHVYQISRELSLKSYTPCFASILQKPVYFDHKRDELLLGSSQALHEFTSILHEKTDLQEEEKINFLSLNIFSGSSIQRRRNEIEDFYDVLSLVFEAQARLEDLVSKFSIPKWLTVLVPEGRLRFVSTFRSLFKDQGEPEISNFAFALGISKRHITVLKYGLSDDGMSMVETLLKWIQDGGGVNDSMQGVIPD